MNTFQQLPSPVWYERVILFHCIVNVSWGAIQIFSSFPRQQQKSRSFLMLIMLHQQSSKFISCTHNMRIHFNRCRIEYRQRRLKILTIAWLAWSWEVSGISIHRCFNFTYMLIVATHPVTKNASLEVVIAKGLHLAFKSSLVDRKCFIMPTLRQPNISQYSQGEIPSNFRMSVSRVE